MIKIVSILFIIAAFITRDDKPKTKQYPREGIIYSFTGCTINYDAEIIWCLASTEKPFNADEV